MSLFRPEITFWAYLGIRTALGVLTASSLMMFEGAVMATIQVKTMISKQLNFGIFDFSNKKWDKYTKELKGKDLIVIYKNEKDIKIHY